MKKQEYIERSMAVIYDLDLHEYTDIEGWRITRVPGGWIYTMWDYERQDFSHSLFVPFNNRFQQKK